MDNVLLRYLRIKAHFTAKKTAKVLGIDLMAYQQIENGELPLTKESADVLGKLFDMNPEVLHATSLQLEMLRTNQELIQRQNSHIEILKALVRHLKPTNRQHSKN